MKLLAIETTCDETAAAIITDDLEVLSTVVASQEALHEQFKGVVPEIAARAHLERIIPVLEETVARANCDLQDIDAVAVANTPGLAGSLLVGLCSAKALCLALDKPLVAVNHLHAHIYACKIAERRDVFPCVGMIVSGGHSSLYDCASPSEFEYLGGTIDDAAGEAFDKVASMLGLSYPGGPSVSKAAVHGDPKSYSYPRPFLKDADRLDFSFSGLKTAVRYSLYGVGNPIDPSSLSQQQVADVAASFQQAVVDCLVGKASLAIEKTKHSRLCVGGGVAANRDLRDQLAVVAEQKGFELSIAPMSLCTDNAVMGAIAFERLKAGKTETLDLDALPGLVRPSK